MVWCVENGIGSYEIVPYWVGRYVDGYWYSILLDVTWAVLGLLSVGLDGSRAIHPIYCILFLFLSCHFMSCRGKYVWICGKEGYPLNNSGLASDGLDVALHWPCMAWILASHGLTLAPFGPGSYCRLVQSTTYDLCAAPPPDAGDKGKQHDGVEALLVAWFAAVKIQRILGIICQYS